MPIIYQSEKDSFVSWAIWHITETEESLFKNITLSEEDSKRILDYKLPKRRLEKLACRQTLAFLLNNPTVCLQYTSQGQPIHPAGYISFSHSSQYAAVAFSPSSRIGIDIETIGQRILPLRAHFLTTEEIHLHDTQSATVLHQLWGAKEAMIKLYGKKEIDFHNKITITDTSLKQGIIHAEKEIQVDLVYKQIDDQMVVLATEIR